MRGANDKFYCRTFIKYKSNQTFSSVICFRIHSKQLGVNRTWFYLSASAFGRKCDAFRVILSLTNEWPDAVNCVAKTKGVKRCKKTILIVLLISQTNSNATVHIYRLFRK